MMPICGGGRPPKLDEESVVTFTEEETNERIYGVLEPVREQDLGQRILLVLAKHGAHIRGYTHERAHRLGIDLIVLPSGSLHLNPIEKVRDPSKWTVSPIIVQDEGGYFDLVKDVFDQITHRVSSEKKSVKKFLSFQKLFRLLQIARHVRLHEQASLG